MADEQQYPRAFDIPELVADLEDESPPPPDLAILANVLISDGLDAQQLLEQLLQQQRVGGNDGLGGHRGQGGGSRD